MTQSEHDPEPAGAGPPVGAVALANAAPKSRQRTTAATRVEGLSPQAIRCLQLAARAVDMRELDAAATALRQAASIAPEHPEILRISGVLEYRRGHFAEAIALFRRTLTAWPDDALALGNLGSAFADSGRIGEALLTLQRATEVAPEQPGAWFNLGKVLDAQAHVAEAEKAFVAALERAPRHLSARIAHANTLATLGRTADAAAEYRTALTQDPRSVQSWLGLVNLKTIRLEADEADALERLHADPALTDADRAVAGFALGKVLEDNGRYADAFAVLSAANAVRRRASPWDASAFSNKVDAIAAAFESESMPHADDASLGEPVIFVVSLPRSGSTLIEQILAAHRDVEGASELPDLESVILEESARRKQRFPEWVADATAADWQRMGQRYLQRTARWRKQHPRFTDKMPDNWLMVGAALAMLPGARVVNVRRDPVETCWSCFKQLFGAGRHAYSYDLADLAETWRDYDRLCHLWSHRFAHRFREQSYERLLADPENETRALLEFCGLPFDAACLDFHKAERSVRTASAAQVREPLRIDTARSAAYAGLLEPLRRMLAADTTRASIGERDAATATMRSERVQGLGDDDARDLLRAAALLGSGRVDEAAPIIERVRQAHPDHGEALRLAGALESARGRHAEAIATLQRAAALKPDDALILNTLGTAQAAAGDKKNARASFARAIEIDPNAAGPQHNLGTLLVARGEFEAARAAFARAVEIEPGFVPARLALADVLRMLDRNDEATTQLREALALDPSSSAAWESLAELRPAEFSASERSTLESEYQRPRRSDADRAALAFALANVLEGRAQYPEAFASFMTANALRRRDIDWHAARHARRSERIIESFPAEPVTEPASTLGAGCIFVLGMPDASAEAIARVLRAHPAVGKAANPARIIAAESARRGQRFSEWAALATADDWQRLGRAYLDRSPASAHTHRVLDASSFRAEHAGAVASMLPAARFVTITGDALERCWTCFRNDYRGEQRYSYDFSDLAAFWHDQQRLLRRWRERFGDRVHDVNAETLRTQPDVEITRLLEHCGLDADASATRALDISRARQRADAHAYGDLLKPLASMLDSGDGDTAANRVS